MPKVSVIIPTFNASIFLPATMAAIRSQTFADFEIIVVDDKSTDNTREVVLNLDSSEIRYHCLKKNHGGPSLPRNIGIKMANGEYIAFCDSDDIWQRDHLLNAVNLLDSRDELGMVFTDAEKVDFTAGQSLGIFLYHYDRFKSLPKTQLAEHFYTLESNTAFPALFYENFILTCGVVVRRKVFDEVGLFDERLTNADDWDMWLRITRVHSIGFIDLPGFQYRIRSGSISGRGPILAENRTRVLRKQLELGLPTILTKRCHQLIAYNYYGIGHYYQSKLDMSKAREQFLLSLRTFWNWAAVKGYLISLSGSRFYNTLRRIKYALNR